MKWGVVILAGGFVPDPLATRINSPRKCLAKVKGKSVIFYTLQAIKEAGFQDVALVSGEDVENEVHHGKFIPEGSGQIDNARKGVEALPDCDSILFLPCDSPFLTANGIKHFVQEIEKKVIPNTRKWYSAGICASEDFDRLFPEKEHPNIKLKEGNFMSGAYYATSREGFFQAADLFEELSESRKSQFKILLKFGIGTIIKYIFNKLTIKQAEEKASSVFGGSATVILGCDPESIVDIDTIEDYEFVLSQADRFLKD